MIAKRDELYSELLDMTRIRTDDTQNIRIDVSNEEMKMKITNNVLSERFSLKTQTGNGDTGDYSIFVNRAMLTNCIKNIESEEVDIRYDDKKKVLVIRDGNSNKKKAYTLRVEVADEYEEAESDEMYETLRFKPLDIIRGLKSVVNMVAKDEKRWGLQGVDVKVRKEDGMVELYATDSFRLAKKKVRLDGDVESDAEIIVPETTVEYIIAMMEKFIRRLNEEGYVEMKINERVICMGIGDKDIRSALIMKNYPDLNRLIPTAEQIPNRLIISKERLEDIVKCALFKSEDYSVITMNITDKGIDITNENSQLGSFNEHIDSGDFQYKGDDLKISFKNSYLKEAIATFESGHVVVGFKGDFAPFVIVGNEQESDKSLMQLILPVRSFK